MLHTITKKASGHGNVGALPAKASQYLLIPVAALGMSLGLFFVIGYVACLVFYLLFPDLLQGHALLSLLLPGFKLLDWPNFFLGLSESLGLGWYIALVFGPLFNFFAARSS